MSMHRIALLLVLVLVAACSAACSKAAPQPWREGTRYAYGVRMSSTAMADVNAPAPVFDFELEGELVVTPIDVDKQKTRLALSFSRASFTTQQGAAAEQRFAKVARELVRPHVFTFVDGVHLSGAYPKDGEAVTVAIMRTVAAQLQLSPAPDGVNAWQSSEYDATGRYRASYQRPSHQTLTRKKLSYEALTLQRGAATQLAGAQAPVPKIVESHADLTFTDAALVSLRARERVDMELILGRALVTRTSIALDLKSQQTAGEVDIQAITRDHQTLSASAPYVHASAWFDLDQAKIGERTFDQVISELESLAREGEDVPLAASRNDKRSPADEVDRGKDWMARSHRQFLALSAMLRKNESDVDRAAAIVRAESPAAPVILSSLGAAGTDGAQQMLVTLMKDAHLPEDTRKAAGISLLRTRNPTVRSAEALEALLGDAMWRNYAELGLGTYVRLFGEASDSEAMHRFGRRLLAHLEGCSSDAQRIDALTALSNSGYVPALTPIKRLLKHENAEVRAAAVQSLRLMQNADVERTITAVLREDAERDVRVGALQALRNRAFSPELAGAVQKRLEGDADTSVRLKALEVLEPWSKQQPPLREAMQRAAQGDSSDTVRDAAAAALQRSAPAAPPT